MADQTVPQGVVGSPTRRSEPRAASGEARPGQPHATTDGVPEAIDGASPDRQSRRYAHTMRRELSAPVRVPETIAESLAALDDQFDIATIARPKPTRPLEPTPSPAAEPARASAPSESTALYRKRTNPSLPTISPDLVARSAPAPAAHPPVSTALSSLARDDDPSDANDDAPSRLPSVVLDIAGSGRVVSPLALRRPPTGLVVAIAAAALIVIAVWLLRALR